MADSTGISASAVAPLSNWEHVEQSIGKILTTPLGSRVMRRNFGSRIPDLIDAKMTRQNVLAIYAAAADAIRNWEPRFRLTSASIEELTEGGKVGLVIAGTYYPKGHLGNYTIFEDRTSRVTLSSL